MSAGAAKQAMTCLVGLRGNAKYRGWGTWIGTRVARSSAESSTAKLSPIGTGVERTAFLAQRRSIL